ncbi:MAG: cytochrome C oxidase assembly protein, partial [Tistrella sp.]|nr:cytochrome C oxidase assembly protein [Tistrella sp.]
LSYTFFAQEGLSPEEIAAARDLSGESETLDAALKTDETAGFANDAPRR